MWRSGEINYHKYEWSPCSTDRIYEIIKTNDVYALVESIGNGESDRYDSRQQYEQKE